MAYIESHQTLPRHPKTRKAARLLGVSVPAVIGHLHCLWYWAMDYAQDGDLTPHERAELADAAMWEGEADALIVALTAAGFLDETPDGGLVIHEWMEYAGKLIEKRKSDAARKRAHRLGLDVQSAGASVEMDIQRTSSGHPADIQRTAQVPYLTVPNPTVPYLTVPNQIEMARRKRTRVPLQSRSPNRMSYGMLWLRRSEPLLPRRSVLSTTVLSSN